MQMPRAMRRINRDFTNRVMGPVAARVPPMAVVHHVGRKSGKAYRTPVVAFPVRARILTPLPYGTDTDWLLNLQAAGSGELEVAGKLTKVEHPRVLGVDELAGLVPEAIVAVLRALDLPGFVLLDRA